MSILSSIKKVIILWERLIGADAISKSTGGTFGVEEYITMQTVYDDFLSPDEIEEGMFNPGHPPFTISPFCLRFKVIKSVYFKYTRLPEKMLNEILKHDLWFDAKTCLKHGLVDAILE